MNCVQTMRPSNKHGSLAAMMLLVAVGTLRAGAVPTNTSIKD